MFTFFRQSNGSEPRREIQIRSCDLNVQRLATVFKVDIQDLYLEEEITGQAEFPNDRGLFNTQAWDERSSFRVQGERSTMSTETNSEPSTSSGPPSRMFAARSSQFRSVMPSSRTPPPGFTVRPKKPFIRKTIILSKPLIVRGKLSLGEAISTHYITFTDEQANTPEVANMVSLQLEGEHQVTLLDSKLNELPEITTAEYWRPNSRRVHATLTTELESVKQRLLQTRKRNILAATLDDYEDPVAVHDDVNEKLNAIEAKVTTVSEVCEAIRAKMEERASQGVLTLKERVSSNMTCTICRDVWTTPVRLAECCNSILGCDLCIQQWMEDNTTRPHCNTENATTILVRGLDGLVQE